MATIGQTAGDVGKGISLVVSLLITGVMVVVLVGAGLLAFYKTDDDSKKVEKDRRIAGAAIAAFAVIIIVVVWAVDWLTRRSAALSEIEGLGGMAALV